MSPLLNEAPHCRHQQLVGMSEWAVQIGRFCIRYDLTSLNRFLESPREGHLSWLVKIFGYLQSVTGRRKCIVVSSEDTEEIRGKGANMNGWLEKYTGVSEDIDEGLPDPRGRPISTSVYFDSGHAHDQVTRRLVSGVLCFFGYTTIYGLARDRVPSRALATLQNSTQVRYQRKKRSHCSIG